MIDTCSLSAHTDLEKSGKIGHDQRLVLSVFQREDKPLMVRDVFNQISHLIDFNGCRSRITELTDRGILEKADKDIDPITHKKVNKWRIKTSWGFRRDLFF